MIFEKITKQFKIHQCYEQEGDTKPIECEKCEHDKFYVGCGSYFTAVKCLECGHEECVHDG